MGKGTPAKAATGQLQASWKRIVMVYQEVPEPIPLVDLSPREAQLLVLEVMSPDAHEKSDQLSLALGEYVERTGILAGFSSSAIAIACTIATESVLLGRMLKADALKKLRPNYNAMRSAYNSLWMRRDKLSSLIWQYGGHFRALRRPLDAYGMTHEKLIKVDLEGKIRNGRTSGRSKRIV